MNNDNTNTALATRGDETATALATNGTAQFDLVKAQLDAELEKNLRQLSVTEFVSPTSILDSDKPLAVSKPFDLLDCFEFELQDKDELKTVVIYLCDFGEKDGVKTIAQSLSTQRERWINTFSSARVAKTQLTLTQIRFRRLNKGGKANNFPIVIELTKDSQVLKRPIV